jgi:hypothetical protein
MAEQCSDRLREGRETQVDIPSVAVSELMNCLVEVSRIYVRRALKAFGVTSHSHTMWF